MTWKIRQIVGVSLMILVGAIPGVAQVSVLTQHNDNARTGQNLSETTLNTSNVNENNFGKLFYRTVDGEILAQPLYVPGLTIGGATHNVVYVATEHNSVYAFDADNPNEPAPLWQVNLGTSVPMEDICIITGDTNPDDCPYFDISPEIGITSTPVIDPTAGIIYVVARTKNTSNSTYHYFIHALSLTNGSEQLGGPMEITGQVSGNGTASQNGTVVFDPTYVNQRPSLLLVNGVLYIGFGSVGDIGGYHGWVMSYNATTLQQEGIFNVTPNGSDGGVWSAGQGLVSDSANNVYAITSNGDFTANQTGGTDYGDTYVKFNGPTLGVADYFTPDNQGTLGSNNIDLGSGGPMLMPGTSLLVGMGKDGILRVVNTSNMGKYNSSVDNDVQEFPVNSTPFFSSPIYWNSPNHGPVIYLWEPSDFLKAFAFNGSLFNTTPVTEGTVQNAGGFSNAAALSVSANGSLTGTGILWTSRSISGTASNGPPVTGVVSAYDATNLTTELWDSTQNLARDDVGTYAKYNPPTVANGKVYVGSFSGELQVYGLNPPAFQGVQFVQQASATPQSTTASVPVAYSAAQQAGDLNVVIVGWNDSTATVQSVTDSAGNTYALAIGPTTGTGLRESTYYAKNIVASNSNTVTVTFNQGATKPDIRILEYSGVSQSNPLDVSTGSSGDGNIADSGFVQTTADNELIVGADMVSSNTTIMAGAPFTLRAITPTDADLAADRVVNVPGSYHSWAPLNAFGQWVMQVVSFRAAVVGTLPFVTGVSPNEGPAAGGTAVTITGTNFAAGATVTFGGAAATNVAVVNSTTITATTPAGSAGAVTVTVTVSGQSGSLGNGFTYVVPPTVSSVSPNSGPAAGGTAVTITGTNFVSGATVTFGGAAATNVAVVNSTTITATTPAGSLGSVTVTVTNIGSQSGSLANGFTYNVLVAIGFSQVSSSTPQSPTATVTVAYPAAQTVGDLNVVVVGWNDTTSTVQSVKDSAGNTYSLGIGPTIGTGLSQSIYYAANIAGGSNTVTVTFSQAAAYPDVRILEYRGVTTLDAKAGVSGNSAAASSGAATTTVANELIFGADTVATGNAAAGSGFTARIITSPDSDLAEDEVVTTAGSYSAAATLSSSGPWVMQMLTFSAITGPAPTVSSVSPNSGTAAGGTAVTITGTNFAAGAAVAFGSTAATNVAVVNSTTITATTPAGSAGAVTVTVTNSGGQSGSLSSAFTYIAVPTVSSVSPSAGPAAGGTVVTITGTNFAAGATVTFGGAAATNVAVVNSTTITATTPAGSAGAVTVTVTVNGQSGSLANGFTYVVAPTVSSVGPNSGSTSGGTAVTITGTNFAAGATVTFGGAAATNVVVVNSTTITATTPAGSAGAVTVTVTNVGSQSGNLASGFTYVVKPTVSSVSPSAGPAAGGTAVTITGTNFAAGATVTFGSTAATNVAVVNSTTITATTPAGSAGAVTVTVTMNGQSGSLANGFTYVVAPTVSSVGPNSGSTAGGTAVTITGTNFAAGATVTFGGAAATNVVVVNSTTITATTPAGSAGAVTVTVTNVGSQSGSLASGFTYVVKPTVSSVAPNNGPTAGGTAVTITGTNFAAGATVTFGSTAATNVAVVNSTTITATTPAGSAGAVTVTVTVGGQSGSLASGFTYVAPPTVSSVSPNNGPTSGGTAVTITGTNFAAGATVTFGGAAATNVAVVNSTTITATTPAGSLGSVTVTVTVNGQSGSLANGFTYTVSAAIGFSQVSSSTPQSPTATVTVAYPAAQTVGDLNVVVVGWNDTTSTVQSVKDSAGNTYSLGIGPTIGTGLSQSIYYAANIAGGSNTVTVTFSQAAAYPDVRILEYRGVTTLDAKAGVSGNSAAASSGAATTTVANELIFGADTVATGNAAAGSGFTARIITSPDSDLAEDEVVTTAGSYSAAATLSSSGPWVMQMLTFSAITGPAPTVSSVSPNSGTAAGGTAVTITGTNFAAGAAVAFGSTAATNVAVVNSTTITATTPAGSAGAVTVTVTNSGGQSGSLSSAFTYIAVPTVSSVSPSAGPAAGGTVVTITGTNFAAGATVTFGGAAATNVAVVNSTTITATTPAGSAGAVTVTVTVNGQSGSLANGFTYVVAPTVSSVGPNSGSTSGGTAVTITGTNFAAGATVTFGGAAATNVVVVNSTTITATTPAGSAGAVTVTVTNVGSQSGNLASGFTYVVKPTVSSVSPSAGPAAGGTAVTITGTNFAAGATVTFGSTAATNVAVVNSTTITATTPAGSAGAVTVTVTMNGQSGSLANGFTYVVAPTVSSVGPNSGSTAGGTAVTITGTNFAAGATVTFGGAAATNVVVVNSTTITATTPAGSAGAVTVTVTNVGSQSGSLASGFTYVVKPTVSSVAPNNGPTAGGTAVTITGTNFAAGATVTFGSTAATNVAVVNSTTITATTPAGSAGAVTVTVTVGGQSGSLASGFTYVAPPTVSSVSPNNGLTSGGTAVTITGTNFAAGATVTFGGAAATNVAVVNSTTITATTPAGSLGSVTVTVTVNGQSGSLANGFTYTVSAAIGFSQVSSSTPQSPTATVTVAYPAAQTVGDLNVVVVGWNDTTSTVQSVKDSAGNTYSLGIGPTIGTGLSQSIYYAANIAGGSNTVTVTFSQAAAYPDVRILEYRGVTTLDAKAGVSGNSAAASSGAATTTVANELIFGADTVATGNAAAGSGFTARIITSPDSDLAEDEVVTTAGSYSAAATLSSSGPWVMQMLTFSAITGPAPTVSSVSPNSGTAAGGTAVTITGTNFAAGAAVAFGSTAATNVAVVNSTTITATTPAGSAGAVTVTVTVSGRAGSLASAFTYVVPPTVSSVSPNSGSTAGGTAVTITGTNFAAGATVTFGGAAATNVAVVNSTTITATTPAGGAGTATVIVANSNGVSGSLASAFTYVIPPTVSGASPNSGSSGGGTAVTITGTNFAVGATVTFGGAAATNVVVVNSTTITATTPAGSAGAVTVTVTVNGQSGNLAGGFTYVITSVITPPGNFTGALMGTSVPTYISGQQFYNSTAGSSFTSSAFDSTGADLLVMFLGCHNNTVFTITDNFGNTWLPLAGPASRVGIPGFPMEGELFYAPNAKTGAGHTITVGLSQPEPLVMSIAAIAGDNIYSPIDAYSFITNDNGTTTEYVAGSSLTTFQPNDMLLGIVKGWGNNTYTAGTGYTSQAASTGLNFSAETGTASSTGNYNSSFTAAFGDRWQTVLAAIASKLNESVFSWTASTPASTGGPITNYDIERCAGLSCSNFSQIASVSGSTLTYTDTSISSGIAYNYRVRAVNQAGTFSDYSGVQALNPIIPEVVSSLAATPTRKLAWNASSEGGGIISQYSIERCAGLGCSNFSQSATTASTSYTDTSAAAGTTYNYRVRAQDANGFYGPYSPVAAASIPAYFDNAADGGNNGGSTASLTYSYTVGTNSNRLLLVNLVGDTSADDISSVTYAGAPMTLIKKIQTPSDRWHYLYYLLSPASGTNNVIITAAGSHYLISEASSWYNVSQSGQPLASTTNTASSTVSLTTSLPASSNGAIVAESMWSYSVLIPNIGSAPLIVDSAFDGLGMFSSVPSPVTQAFPVSMTNTWGGQDSASSIMASFTLASNGTAGITFDNSVDGGNNGGSTASLTYSYAVGSGSNRLLVVNLVGDTSADDISSVTYGGTAMKLLAKIQAPSSNNWQYLYYLLNPSSGSQNVVVTAGSSHYLISQAASWFNVKQSAQPDAFTTNTAPAANTSTTTSLTTVATGSLVLQGLWSYGHLAPGTGATPITIDATFGGAGIFVSCGSPVSPAGNVSMTTISDGSISTGVIMASFAPAP